MAFLLVCVFLALYRVEKAAIKQTRFAPYAWLARGLRHLLFFAALGDIIFLGTDWRNPYWEHRLGIICILIGIALFARTVAHRKDIQAGLESRRIKAGD